MAFFDGINRKIKKKVDRYKEAIRNPTDISGFTSGAREDTLGHFDRMWENPFDPDELFTPDKLRPLPLPGTGLVGPSREQTVMSGYYNQLQELRKKNGQGAILGGDMMAEANAPTASQFLFGGMEDDYRNRNTMQVVL